MNTDEKANGMADNYAAQLDGMAQRAKDWRAANPGKKPLVQFNHPETVAIVGCISDALEHHFVSANADGTELIKALWPWGGRDEPTVLMVRIVLENSPTNP